MTHKPPKKAKTYFLISLPYIAIIYLSQYLNPAAALLTYKLTIMITALGFFIGSIIIREKSDKEKTRRKGLINYNKKKQASNKGSEDQ
jgi:phosphotransferase system  glucose/maltose/N-acetylglucosamine-specific IIC component